MSIYFGGVTATQALFRTLTGQERSPQLVVVASTLVIAALFNPLRQRIQSFIDLSFYRSKYDAPDARGVSMKLRDETDLEAFSDELVGVVRGTMQPAHVSFWAASRPTLARNQAFELSPIPKPRLSLRRCCGPWRASSGSSGTG